MDLNSTRNRVLLAVAALCALAFVAWTLVRPGDRPTTTEPEAIFPEETVRPDAKSPKPRPRAGDPTVGEGAGLGRRESPGLQGGSALSSFPSHRVVLTLTSAAKLPFVKYYVPTSRDNRGGTLYDLGTSWSTRSTAYGKPDYAWVFTRADPRGTPITCTVTVDGKLKARLTSKGPYGKVFCQG